MTELEANQKLDRTAAANYLREFADQLDTADSVSTAGSRTAKPSRSHDDQGETNDVSRGARESSDAEPALEDRVTIYVGTNSVTVNPPAEIQFDISVDDDESMIGSETERHVTFDLSWDTETVENPEIVDIE